MIRDYDGKKGSIISLMISCAMVPVIDGIVIALPDEALNTIYKRIVSVSVFQDFLVDLFSICTYHCIYI